MGSRPLRMKVRWGCPPRVLSPPPHRTQSWRPCLPGQPWASGWRSTDRPVPSPRGWTIGFSERGAAHNRALPRCLSSRRCMRSWRVRGWPLSRPEAARPPPPSSLPSMAEWPGGTRAFPRWRERSRCTCAHETPPLGGTVRVSRPRPVEPVPPAEMRQGFYSPYFIVPKKGGGLRPILDLRVLNRALHKLPFKMLTHRRMIKCIQPQDWFAAIDLKDAYFHVSILPRHRPFLRFAFEGRAWQYRVLPFGLSLSPRVFTKVVEGALTPLREVGVRILNYLDDWLILAQSREQLGDHRDLVLRHLSQLGLRVNWEKSKLSPVQRISFLGVELDSVSMTARLTEERAQAVLNCLSSFRGRNVVPLKQFQRLLGHMASAAAVTLLGLLHMRPLQHWLHSRVPRWAWRRGTLRVGISQQCRRSLSPWTDLAFLRAGVPLEQCPGILLSQQMPPARTGALHATGRQPRGSGQGPDCFGTSTAWSCGQCI